MFCKKCGKEISEDEVFCKYCGTNQKEVEQKTENKPTVPTLKIIYFISDIIGLIGALLLGYGIYQEHKFRTNYNITNLSDAGIDAARKLTPYSSSMTYITIGAIIFIVATLVSLRIFFYAKKNNINLKK